MHPDLQLSQGRTSVHDPKASVISSSHTMGMSLQCSERHESKSEVVINCKFSLKYTYCHLRTSMLASEFKTSDTTAPWQLSDETKKL